MTKHRNRLFVLILASCWPAYSFAQDISNKSFEGKYKTTAHFCMAGQCEDRAETLTSAFFVGPRNVHVYSGDNKGLVLPFGQRNVSADGKSVWMVRTAVGFDESYARDGFTITHHYAIHSNGSCSVSVSVVKAPARTSTSYRTEMESCKVVDGNMFASQ